LLGGFSPASFGPFQSPHPALQPIPYALQSLASRDNMTIGAYDILIRLGDPMRIMPVTALNHGLGLSF